MPKRTNDFQTLIAAIERQVAPAEAEVSESELVVDRLTGEQREVDIYIRQKIGQHPVTIGIECVDHGRRVDVNWVESKLQKHADLGTSQPVLVSRNGFTKSAREKATRSGAQILTLGQAVRADWSEAIHQLQHFSVLTTTAQVVGQAQLVTPGEAVPEIDGEPTLFNAEGTALGPIGELINGRLDPETSSK